MRTRIALQWAQLRRARLGSTLTVFFKYFGLFEWFPYKVQALILFKVKQNKTKPKPMTNRRCSRAQRFTTLSFWNFKHADIFSNVNCKFKTGQLGAVSTLSWPRAKSQGCAPGPGVFRGHFLMGRPNHPAQFLRLQSNLKVIPEKAFSLKEMGCVRRETLGAVPTSYPDFWGFVFGQVNIAAQTQIHLTNVCKDPFVPKFGDNELCLVQKFYRIS